MSWDAQARYSAAAVQRRQEQLPWVGFGAVCGNWGTQASTFLTTMLNLNPGVQWFFVYLGVSKKWSSAGS